MGAGGIGSGGYPTGYYQQILENANTGLEHLIDLGVEDKIKNLNVVDRNRVNKIVNKIINGKKIVDTDLNSLVKIKDRADKKSNVLQRAMTKIQLFFYKKFKSKDLSSKTLLGKILEAHNASNASKPSGQRYVGFDEIDDPLIVDIE